MSYLEASVERRSLRIFKEKAQGEAPTWLTVLNSLFYVVVVLAIIGFGYYLYTFQRDQGILTLYFPFLLRGAEVTIVVSLISMELATIFVFIGAFGSQFGFAHILMLSTDSS